MQETCRQTAQAGLGSLQETTIPGSARVTIATSPHLAPTRLGKPEARDSYVPSGHSNLYYSKHAHSNLMVFRFSFRRSRLEHSPLAHVADDAFYSSPNLFQLFYILSSLLPP